jgi:hypothetical protein
MTDAYNNPEPGKSGEENSILSAIKGNPKALYGLIAAIAIVTLGLALFGGGESKVVVNTAISKGQSVVLENPNGGLSHVTAAPGMMGAQTAEEDVEQDICVANSGTHATVEDEQVTGLLPYVKVAISDGPCQGKSGWTSKVNVKGQ